METQKEYYTEAKKLPISEAQEWIKFVDSPKRKERFYDDLKETGAGLTYLYTPYLLSFATGGVLSVCGHKDGADAAYLLTSALSIVWPLLNIGAVADTYASFKNCVEYLGMRNAKSKLEKEMGEK